MYKISNPFYGIFILFFVLSGSSLMAQNSGKFKRQLSFSAGMGVNYGITPEFKDYLIASIPYSTSDSINSFNAGIEFFGGVEYELTRSLSLKTDYSYYVRSLNYVYSPAVFDYTITSHQPFLFVYYNLKNLNYNFKFGAGIGYHFQKLDNKINNTTTLSYTSGGPSVRGEIVFMPKLSKNFYGYLSGFAFGNFYSMLKDENGSLLKALNSGKEAGLSGYGIGARLGFILNLN